ncbi:MAG: hypothetical protein Athens101428_543 [Candidatus Berkelbacteria bacterium Athens1014_28]|uniref:DUF11 domain-containing protein n=1 Tax=Candidatus Berkelbacteria bacterium Athens1014_28 TaxID=2017145 RepID=A0A554LLJ7_9BACT|nr:MAG: hypothetical protein Athens101428_543 [Candidatus Berkelbacteria bacterium Athens1014_28]
MVNFWKFIKTCKPKAKSVFSILAIASVVSLSIFSTLKLGATAPRFNFMQNDYELLRGANLTKGESVWKDPVAGNVGDTFQAIVYYHNGMIDTVAENTKIKVTLPKETTNKSAKLSISLSADNAATITDTIVNGKIVGASGLTINLDNNADLALVPGSVKWYPDQLQNTDLAVSLPYSQTGDEITTTGVNIGNIAGCWEYAGYLVFNIKSTAKPALTPILSVDKTVRNISTKEIAYTDLTKAHANEIAEFKIEVTDNGQTNLENVILKDQLPAELSYVSNSMVMNKDNQPQNLTDAVANQIFTTGWNSGTLNINKKITLIFSTKAPSAIWSEKTVTNTFTATSGALSKSDTAKVTLVPEISSIVQHKTAKNLTSGKDAIVQNINGKNIQTVSAVAGDEIKYTLSTSNSVANTVAGNYVIEDGITDILEYADVISISDGGSVVAGTSGNDAMLVRWPAVSIAYNQPITRTFSVKVKNPLPTNPQNGYHFDYQMYNVYGDEVIVTISKPAPLTPILNIDKLVRNVTTSEITFVKSNKATVGDTIEYLINFGNSGVGVAKNVRIVDVLPAGLKYISGTGVLSISGGAEGKLTDDIIASGVIITEIPAGQSGYIKLSAVSTSAIKNKTVLTNTSVLSMGELKMNSSASTEFSVKTTLPKTGSDLAVIVAIAGLLFIPLAYRVTKF